MPERDGRPSAPNDDSDQDEVPAPASVSADDRKSERRHTLAIALMSGLIGIVGTIGGSIFQSISANSAQNAGFAEERAKEDREHRAKAYFAFLNATDKYAETIEDLSYCVYGGIEQCGVETSDLIADISEFEKTLDQVLVYGSTSAIDAAYEVDGKLINSRPHLGKEGWSAGTGDPFDTIETQPLYSEFLSVVCREVPGRPRQDC